MIIFYKYFDIIGKGNKKILGLCLVSQKIGWKCKRNKIMRKSIREVKNGFKVNKCF